jgi:nitrate reductase assembly molybdenum cofactor insertion protein NarJ
MARGRRLSSDAARLLAEAAEWRLLGLLFEYPAGAWRAQLEALIPDLAGNLRAMGEAALRRSSPGLHIALFGPGGSVPVREVSWRGGIQSGHLMSEIAAYYGAFGYRPSEEEASDHLAIQLGFVSFLRMKQALALSLGEIEHARIAAEAAERFIGDHIAVSAAGVAKALEAFAPEYLIEAGRRVLRLAGAAPQSGYPLSAGSFPEDDSEEMTCGSPPAENGLVQLPGQEASHE